MKYVIVALLCYYCFACTSKKIIVTNHNNAVSGSAFYEATITMGWKQRDAAAANYLQQGNIPSFLQYFVSIKVWYTDTVLNKTHQAIYYVAKDYLSIGTKKDWARIPLTPIAAQQVANTFKCFLPTAKMVNDIYKQATVKLAPVPMYIYRDSTLTMWQHHLIIEGQRKNRKGLIAGIKKDVVLTAALATTTKQNKVAIYGWHLINGKPIQPIYTGHVNWYVDYSHGVRLVYQYIKINGKWMHYEEVLQHPIYKWLLTNEVGEAYTKYPIQF